MEAPPQELPFGDAIVVTPGTVVATEGDDVASVRLIERGVVALTKSSESGAYHVGVFGAGYLVGSASVLARKRQLATVVAWSEVSFRPIDVRTFHECSRRDAGAASWVANSVAETSAHLFEQLAGELGATAEERAIALFRHLFALGGVSDGNGGRRLTMPLAVSGLAAAIRVDPSTASRLLKELSSRGVVSRNGNGWFEASGTSPVFRSDRT